MSNLEAHKGSEKATSKPQIEAVQKEKMQYTLLGTAKLRRGLKLFSFNPKTQEITEVKVENKKAVQMGEDGTVKKVAPKKATVDTKHVLFQALNMKSAEKRVQAWKEGKKQLDNLLYPGMAEYNIRPW